MLTNIQKIEDRKYLKKKLESIIHIIKLSISQNLPFYLERDHSDNKLQYIYNLA